MKKNQLTVTKPASRKQIDALACRMDKRPVPRPKDEQRFRQMVLSNPAEWDRAVLGITCVQHQLIEKIASGAGAAGVHFRTEIDVLKKQFAYDQSPAMERILIDQIITARIRVIDAENRYSQKVVNKSLSIAESEYWDNLVSSANSRLRKSIESLARVQRMARHTPAVQIHIDNTANKQGEPKPVRSTLGDSIVAAIEQAGVGA